jgi:hypothetical protein
MRLSSETLAVSDKRVWDLSIKHLYLVSLIDYRSAVCYRVILRYAPRNHSRRKMENRDVGAQRSRRSLRQSFARLTQVLWLYFFRPQNPTFELLKNGGGVHRMLRSEQEKTE